MSPRQNTRSAPLSQRNEAASAGRVPRPALSSVERRALDRQTVAVLAAAGIDARPPVETRLRVVGTDKEVVLDQCRERWASVQCGHARAVQGALTFDAFVQHGADLTGLRHIRLRPKMGKTPLGRLNEDLRTFSKTLGRELGRLVTARKINPLLIAIHVRFDKDYGMWDLHAHVLWTMMDADAPKTWDVMVGHFADAWQEPDQIRRPGALSNYIMSGIIDYRAMPEWPTDAVVELWNLPRSQLLRPLGSFAAFRRATRGKVLRRGDGIIRIEDRVRDGLRSRQDAYTVGETEARVVAFTTAKIDGAQRLCAVVKRRRDGSLTEAEAAGGDAVVAASTSAAAPGRATVAQADVRGDVSDSDNRRNSPTCLRAWGTEGITGRNRDGSRWRFRLPARQAWWLTAWPSVGSRLSAPLLRRLPTLLDHSRARPRGLGPAPFLQGASADRETAQTETTTKGSVALPVVVTHIETARPDGQQKGAIHRRSVRVGLPRR